jgi:nucleotide-binding universal stress UspA family protein
MENIKILVPLDFSDLGSKALHSAAVMAKLFNGSITPFHSYLPLNDMDGGPYTFGMGTTVVENYEEIEDALHERLAKLASEEVDKSLLSLPRVSMGNAAQAITEEASEFDMIVMTTHGRTGFSRFFLGSVSEKVLRSSHIPVLIVNEKRELTAIDRIMLTTDFSEHSKKAFPYAKEIAQKAGAELELVNIITIDGQNPEEEERKKQLRKQRLVVLAKEELHEVGDNVKTKVIASSTAPHEAILNYNLSEPHDLIVMSTVGRTGIDYLMMGSTTANVVRHVMSPVLSINPRVNTE